MSTTTVSKYKTLSLREAGKFDKEIGAREKLTGWGKVCKDRHVRGVSRKARIRAKKESA